MEKIQKFNLILKSFNIKASCVSYQETDNYFYYDIKLENNVRVKTIQRYSDEIALALKTVGKPNIKILHQEGIVRLEFVLPRTNCLKLFDYFTNTGVPKGDLVCLLGQSITGQRVWMDLAKNPHMIVAGTTGSGKSTLLHNIIANLFNYNDVYFYMLDFKGTEFLDYDLAKINNMNIGYTYSDALNILDAALLAMEHRYNLLRQGLSIKSLKYIVIIIDEFADLIMQDQDNLFYSKLCKLSQKCRAAKMSIILSTQRPSVDVISGAIKTNFPCRISTKVSTHVDSKVVLDSVGAENLLGHGDALLKDNFRFMERFQIAHTTSEEVCDFFRRN
jgi:S-DNA-T family DNA segregation ATPase FtsK/SpoIIIE